MNEKKIMILGASYSQIPLYQAAKRMGIRTIAASIPGSYDGFAYADEICYVDIADPDSVVEKAKKYQIDGIATCSLDLGMASIGAVCEEMNLYGPSRQAALRASNKWEMKKALVGAGVQTAAFFAIHNEKELENAIETLHFPLIVKAVDLMGSRGIFRSNTPEEVRENYKKTMEATKKSYCLVEEFIEGEIFGVEAMMQNGEIIYQLPNNIEVFYGDTPSPLGHSVPFKHLATLGMQISDQVEKAITALGLDNCPINCDMIQKDGKVYVIELSGRSGATGLAEMVGIYYNLEYYEMILRVALGMSVKKFFQKSGRKTPCLSHTLTTKQTGIVKNIINQNKSTEDIIELFFNIHPGDLVRSYQNGKDRIGQVILKGKDLESCERRLEKVLANIKLEIE